MAKIHILGLVGSPRKNKNTDTLVSKVLEGARSAYAQTTKIYLNDLEIKPCQACTKHPFPEYCFFKDGMYKLYKLFEKVDGIVLGTPAYYETISSQTKLMIDRCNCLSIIKRNSKNKIQFDRRIKKKKLGIFIWVADCSKNISLARRTLTRWFSDVNLEIYQTLALYHADTDSNRIYKLIPKATELGIELVHKIKKSRGNRE
jgi:hypothetical protein